jgi:hypothetical protein
MPAIQLDRLKAQVSQIGEEFTQPAGYIRRLHALLDFYADRTRRPGGVHTRTPRLPHYNTPRPVIRELQRDLSSRAKSSGAGALALADQLWLDGGFEMRLLSAHLLTCGSYSTAEVTSRLEKWIQPDEDSQVLSALLENGYTALARSEPQAWLSLVKAWLAVDRTPSQSLGLQALNRLAEDPAFENFPLVFSLIGPLVQAAPTPLLPDLSRLLEVLARRIPAETAYFLRQALAVSPSRNLPRLVRRCLPTFEPALQQPLREILASRSSFE